MTLQPSIIDGFSYDQKLLPVLHHFRTHAVAQMATLRQANGYQMQWLVMPDDDRRVLPAYETIEHQQSVPPGSWIWGFNVTVVSAGVNTPINLSILVEDEGSGQKWFSDFVRGNEFGLQRIAGDNGRAPGLLPQPFPVMEPGRINVIFANNSTAAINIQLVLNVARFCEGRIYSSQECRP